MSEEKTTLTDEVKAQNERLKSMDDKIEKLLNAGAKVVKPKKLGSTKLKKGNVRYVFIKENGNMTVLDVPVEEGTTTHEKIPRIATPEHVLNWDGTPTIMQPSWSSEPFSPAQNMEKTARDKMLSVGYRLLTNRQELGEIKAKKGLPGWAIFLIIAVIIVVGYLLLR